MKGKIISTIIFLLLFACFLIFCVSNLNASCGIWVGCAGGGLVWCEVFGICLYGETCAETWFSPGVICGCHYGPGPDDWAWGVHFCPLEQIP